MFFGTLRVHQRSVLFTVAQATGCVVFLMQIGGMTLIIDIPFRPMSLLSVVELFPGLRRSNMLWPSRAQRQSLSRLPMGQRKASGCDNFYPKPFILEFSTIPSPFMSITWVP